MRVIDINVCGTSILVTTADGRRITLDIEDYRNRKELEENVSKTLESNGYER